MVANIPRALQRVKDDLPQMTQRHVCDYLTQHQDWDFRVRMLDPLTTVLLFITQVLHGNAPINHLRRLSGMSASAAAYCQARIRLPRALIEHLFKAMTGELLPEGDEACRWRGHRVWRGDGTGFSMPDTPELQSRFGQPGGQAAGCGFPVTMALVLCNAAGFIVRILACPLRTHEASQMAQLHEELEAGDVLVYDRAACSFANLALICLRNLHAIFRVHQRQIVSFRIGRKHAARCHKRRRAGAPKSQWVQRLGPSDQLVRWFKPSSRPQWMTREQFDALPAVLLLREVRYSVNRKGFRSRSITLVTTLINPPQYPAAELAQQYSGRWDIELNFRHLKQTMRMDVLRCRTVDGVLKELAVFALVYNMVRRVMLRASERQRVPLARISFVDALRWLRDTRDGEDPLDLIVNPSRCGRCEPRVLKRRPKEFPLMKQPRNTLRQALMNNKPTA